MQEKGPQQYRWIWFIKLGATVYLERGKSNLILPAYFWVSDCTQVATDLDPHIQKLHEIIANETYKLSPETRFMLRDILDAWKNSWVFEESKVTDQTKSKTQNSDQIKSNIKNTGQIVGKIEKDETMVFKIAISGSGELNTDPEEVEKESQVHCVILLDMNFL